MLPKKAGAFILDILQTVVLALAIFLIVYLFLLQPHQVRGESMSPTFLDKEYLLTDKISYRFGSQKRGDVIVFTAPPDPTEDYIKRIIGLPNERVSIRENKVYINGELLKEDYIANDRLTSPGPFLPENKEITVPDGEYFVLGDNRSNSSDSRRWGLVTRKKIVGRAWFVYWPPQRAGLVQTIAY